MTSLLKSRVTLTINLKEDIGSGQGHFVHYLAANSISDQPG